MNVDQFSDSSVGQLVPIKTEEAGHSVEHFAFLPSALPERPILDSPTWTAIANAAEMLGRLDSVTTTLAVDPILIARPTIRREALSTSALEGTFAPAADLLISEVDEDSHRTPAILEIRNFITATYHGVARLDELPIGTRFACELQDILVEGTASDDWQRGQVRQTQVLIGPYKGCSVREASYIPPPPGLQLAQGMDDWEQWIHGDREVHPIAMIAMSHYQFEALHPFTDGNGRIGRLIAILQLIEAGIMQQPLINLSPYFETRSDEYRFRLHSVSTDGTWNEWVTFFAQALAAQAEEAINRVRSLLEWRAATRSHLKEARVRGGVATELAASMIEFPTTTVKEVSARFGVSAAAANTAVNRLVELEVLAEVTGRNYNRIFQAPEVIEIIFGTRWS